MPLQPIGDRTPTGIIDAWVTDLVLLSASYSILLAELKLEVLAQPTYPTAKQIVETLSRQLVAEYCRGSRA
ncbi:MAG TPA: hypothetical protein VGM27_16245 [Acidobacteriaceae bacterium]